MLRRVGFLVRASLGLVAPALLAGCPDDATPAETAGSSSSSDANDSSTSGGTTTTTMDPDSSTSVDPDTSTTAMPETTSTEESSTSSDTIPDGCGDGNIDADEACDGSNLDGRDCASEDFIDGVLACNDDCTLDTSGCNAVCGDRNVQGDEQCEDGDLDGADCLSVGFDGGDLTCSAQCTFDTAGCENYVCGDGVRVGTEVCDGADLDDQSCVLQGFDSGTLACAGDCGSFDTAGCFVCGDGAINGTEVCDSADLDGQTCVSLGLDGGVLGCSDTCTFNTAECTGCGNGDQDPGEDCDGSDLGAFNCIALGFDGGTPGCSPQCTITTDSCFGEHEYCTSPGTPIGPGQGAVTTSAIDVSGLAGEVTDVDVYMNATHSFVGELDVSVRHVDSGIETTLASAQCGGLDDVDATFDQDAGAPPSCGGPLGISGEVLPVENLDAYVAVAGSGNGSWELEVLDLANGNGGTLDQWCVQITNELGIPECRNGATLLAMNPEVDQVVCDDPNNVTCEENAEQLCPMGWGLCSTEQHNARNDGFDYAVGATIVVGEIYCRGGNAGAGHLTLGPYDMIANLNQDAPVNCGYGSSRPDVCPSGFGCNELTVQALCCAPNPLCGNGVVDMPEEACDDGNSDESDACLNSCSWRVPADNGQFGTGC